MNAKHPASEEELDQIIQTSNSLAAKDRFDEALAICTWLTENKDTEVAGIRQRAAIRQKMRDDDGAIQDLQRVVTLFPHDPGDFYFLGILLLKNGSTADAIRAFSETIRCDAEAGSQYYTDGALLFRAEAYLKSCDYDEAVVDTLNLRSGFKTNIPGSGMRSKEQIFQEATAALAAKSKFKFKVGPK